MKSIEEIIDSAYQLYMPQVREEIISFARLVSTLRIRNVLEIGTKYGGTFSIWCELCQGKRISVDMVDGMFGGIDGATFERRNKLFQDTYHDVYMIQGNSHEEETKQQVREALNGELVELLFIDGDHTYEGVAKDYEMYRELVRPGGLIAFHDINDTPHHRALNVFVGVFWKELRATKIEFNQHQEWAGIGAIITGNIVTREDE